MSWEFVFKLIGILISMAGLTLAILKFYFDRADKHAKKVKELENALASAAIDQLQDKTDALNGMLRDYSDKHEDMKAELDKLVREVQQNTLKLKYATVDLSDLKDEIKKKWRMVATGKGKIIFIDDRKDEE